MKVDAYETIRQYPLLYSYSSFHPPLFHIACHVQPELIINIFSDLLKGETPVALIVVGEGCREADDDEERNDRLEVICREVVELVRERIGAVASLKLVASVPALPKTRSGKILRNIMRSMANGEEEIRIPGTIEDVGVLEGVREGLEKLGLG